MQKKCIGHNLQYQLGKMFLTIRNENTTVLKPKRLSIA